ncbi:hypothetical protein SAMN04488564_104485 [Lentzea waywayandensis]|uniref:Uncharacterized protein n=1 Tax=Lentzea waywayandensis TaxID=84724 RepID=A0A1I6EH41_9PSEU|nr:hypothetical protein [Lentzea waywayandensis]SFR16987.1 hypothetical protein SAMN04488564_104485 [Lentzea waywayandensis]
MNVTTVVTLVVALGGWVLAATTTWLTYQSKSEENYFRALDWMSGGTQKRNLGIAVIEGSWHKRRIRRISTPLLCSSVIYLLLRSSQHDAAHELNNLRRMMHLLVDTAPRRREHDFHYRALLKALDEKVDPEFRGGLLVPVDDVRGWRARLAQPQNRDRAVR